MSTASKSETQFLPTEQLGKRWLEFEDLCGRREEELNRLQDEKGNLERQHITTVQEGKERIDELEKRTTEQEKEISAQNAEKKAIQAKILTLKKEKESLQLENEQLQNDLRAEKLKNEQLENDCSSFPTVRKTNLELTRRVQQLEAELQSLRANPTSSVSNTNPELTRRVDQLEARHVETLMILETYKEIALNLSRVLGAPPPATQPMALPPTCIPMPHALPGPEQQYQTSYYQLEALQQLRDQLGAPTQQAQPE